MSVPRRRLLTVPVRALLAPALLLLSPRAHAQRPAYAATLSAEHDSATSAALLRELERAASRGIPAEPLIAKAREGRLKRADGARIRLAVAALAVRLDSARGALGPESSADEVVAGADAIAAGAGPEALREVRLASRPRPATVPLGALAQLVASGVPARRATAMVVDLLHRKVAASRLVAFGNAVEADAMSGLPAEEAAIFRLRAASAGSAGNALTSAEVGAPAGPSTPPPNLPGAVTPPSSPPSTAAPRRRP